MTGILAAAVCAVFLVLGSWHFYWALGGMQAKSGAIPEIGGKPAFRPSRAATVAVGLALYACALLVAQCGALFSPILSQSWGQGLCVALAGALTLRAIGDFRILGFFKKVRGSEFARRDTLVYSPLCLALALGVLFVGLTYHAL
jgi:hypothetical protein